jgi:hypothetical protein
MNIIPTRSSVCQPQRCAQTQCNAIPPAARFMVSPRRAAQAVHTTRTCTITRALEDGTDPEEVRKADIVELFPHLSINQF